MVASNPLPPRHNQLRPRRAPRAAPATTANSISWRVRQNSRIRRHQLGAAVLSYHSPGSNLPASSIGGRNPHSSRNPPPPNRTPYISPRPRLISPHPPLPPESLPLQSAPPPVPAVSPACQTHPLESKSQVNTCQQRLSCFSLNLFSFLLLLGVTAVAGEQHRHKVHHARLRRELGERAAARDDRQSSYHCN